MFIKIVREDGPGHHRVKVFSGDDREHLALNGVLVMLGDEADVFVNLIRLGVDMNEGFVRPEQLHSDVDVAIWDKQRQVASTKEDTDARRE